MPTTTLTRQALLQQDYIDGLIDELLANILGKHPIVNDKYRRDEYYELTRMVRDSVVNDIHRYLDIPEMELYPYLVESNDDNIADITLTDQFWDCECKDNYIHEQDVEECSKCEAHRDEQPQSRFEEVVDYFSNYVELEPEENNE